MAPDFMVDLVKNVFKVLCEDSATGTGRTIVPSLGGKNKKKKSPTVHDLFPKLQKAEST